MGNIALFTVDTFMKSKTVLDVRKKQKLKYEEVTVLEVTYGKSQRESYEDQLEKLQQPPTERSTAVSTRSSFSQKNIRIINRCFLKKVCLLLKNC